MRRGVLLWLAFVVVHIWLMWMNLSGPGQPLGDVEWVYPSWVAQGIAGQWVGIDRPFVYPIGALLPIVLPHVVAAGSYPVAWLVMVSVLDAAAFHLLLRSQDRRRTLVAAGWVAYLLALGPIAIGRIDAVTIPLALAAVVVLGRHPRAAAGLLTAAAWIKVWPAVLVGALVVADRRRVIAVTAVGTTLVIVAIAEILGSGANVLSFVTQQTGRGLQIESPAATPFIVLAAAGGPWSLYYDTDILTFQLRGDGVATVAAITTPLLVVLAGALLLIAVVGIRRNAEPLRLLSWLALAMVLVLIAANKVGSPQFITWVAVPLALGILSLGTGLRTGFGVPALGGLLLAALTQAVYPLYYDQLIGLQPVGVAVLVARNAVELGLLALAVTALIRTVRAAPGAPAPPSASTSTAAPLSEGATP